MVGTFSLLRRPVNHVGLVDSPESKSIEDRSDLGRNWRRALARVGVVAWATFIFVLSSIPGSDLPPGKYSTPGHFALYAVLGALILIALGGPTRNRALWAVALASAYGVSDEIHQLFVPGRCADPVDWLVDTAGAITAVGLLLVLTRMGVSRNRN
jgi:peptidoglycan/LPS O-acetylase OafA/YrhL